MNTHLRALLQTLALGALASATYALSACTSTPSNPSGSSGFVSDLPGSQSKNSDAGSGSSSSGGGGESAAPAANGDDDPARAIEEADIIQVQNGRLYALSQFSGLSIVDISNPAHLTLLGRRSMTGIPFEMYLRDGVIYAMFSSYWAPVYDEVKNTLTWQQTSHVQALDVSDPANIGELGEFDLPGNISDSRLVGDVLYAVSYEDGYCWGCEQNKPATTVTSINVSDPAHAVQIDTLDFTAPDPYGYGWWRRSISVNDQRMYVAGIEWDGTGEGHSTIQVVDISDPAGGLVKGATVEAAGQIESRWQMDERDGVLRVVSQPGIWWTNGVPQVQTFTVTSSQEVTPLATMSLTLPKPERLRSVRFDQARAYAITSEQTDPLFTIDLTDPAHPAQLAALEIPGWIYHMEPRGDRLFALGYDNTNEQGSLQVSLFDVADMAHPTMLSRVAFGGQWSSLPEDQDRIHKAFKINDDLGAIFVPYSAWVATNDPYGCGSYESGIQIIDFTNDGLTKRGDAPVTGWTRRSFIDNGKLFGLSDAEVRAYDIANRDAPAALGRLPLSINVTATHVVGDKVVRIAADWWSGQARLDVVPKADPATAEPLSSVDLDTSGKGACGGLSYYGARIFHQGNFVYLIAPSYMYEGPSSQTVVQVFDVSDPSAPALAGQTSLDFDIYGGWWSGNIVSTGDNVVQVGTTLIFQKLSRTSWDENSTEQSTLVLVDLSDPQHPAESASLSMPSGLGHTPLLVAGTEILTSHWETVGDDSGKVRFYLDRVLIMGAGTPLAVPPVNVPGSLAAFDAESGHVLTVDYSKVSSFVANAEGCFKLFGWDAAFQGSAWDQPGLCVGIHRTYKLLAVNQGQASVLDTAGIPDGGYLSQIIAGDDRLFAYSYAGYGWVEDAGGGVSAGPTAKVHVLAGLRAGMLQLVTAQLPVTNDGYPVAADGQNLVLAGYGPPSIAVLDTSDLGNLDYQSKGDVSSYVYQVTIDGHRALASMGPYGLAVVDLH
ncbi:MAG: beta-propeller domain-containing protein [Byssovorax sp.]